MIANRLAAPSNDYTLNDFPDDILLLLICLLDFNDILQLKLVSSYNRDYINKIFLDKNFLELLAKLKFDLTPQQIKETPELKNLFFKRHFLKKIIKKDLTEKKLFVDKNLILPQFPFFFTKRYYKFGGKTFLLKDIYPIILKDDAAALFKQLSCFSQFIPFFSDEASTMDDTNKIDSFIYQHSHANALNNTEFNLSDLEFIKALPFIVKAKALNCFDLFIRAYLLLVSAVGRGSVKNGKAFFNVPCENIFSSADIFFTERFIDLVIKICGTNSIYIYEAMRHAQKKGQIDNLTKCLQKLPPKYKNEIFSYCKKYNICDEVINHFSKKMHNRAELETGLKNALQILQNTPELDIQVLLDLQKNLVSKFEDLKKSLEAENTNEIDNKMKLKI